MFPPAPKKLHSNKSEESRVGPETPWIPRFHGDPYTQKLLDDHLPPSDHKLSGFSHHLSSVMKTWSLSCTETHTDSIKWNFQNTLTPVPLKSKCTTLLENSHTQHSKQVEFKKLR